MRKAQRLLCTTCKTTKSQQQFQQHLSNDSHHIEAGQPQFLEPCSVITWQNLFHFLQPICIYSTTITQIYIHTYIYIRMVYDVLHRIPCESACNSFTDHFNLFKLVWHFKYLNQATQQMSTRKCYVGLRFDVWRSSKWFKFNIIHHVYMYTYIGSAR